MKSAIFILNIYYTLAFAQKPELHQTCHITNNVKNGTKTKTTNVTLICYCIMALHFLRNDLEKKKKINPRILLPGRNSTDAE